MRPTTVPLGVYVDADTAIHKINPGVKFALMLAFIIGATVLARTPLAAGIAVAAMAVMFAVARIPARTAITQLYPTLFILIPLAAFQWWARDLDTAATMFLSIFASLMAAVLLTLTTTIADLMESFDAALAPLTKLGVRTDLISLAMSLTIRLIPLMLAQVHEVLDARKARGVGSTPLAFVTPIIIKALRRARAMGEALAARGVGD